MKIQENYFEVRPAQSELGHQWVGDGAETTSAPGGIVIFDDNYPETATCPGLLGLLQNPRKN